MSQKHLWTIRQAEPATGMKAWAVAQHIDAGTLVLDETERGDIDAKGRGKVRRLSEATILDIAGAARLGKLGFAFGSGIAAMHRFTMLGDLRGGEILREPGKPYSAGETYLIALPDGHSAVVNTDGAPVAENIYGIATDAGSPMQEALDNGCAVALLNLGQLYEQVRSALDLAPQDYRRQVASEARA